MQCLGTPNLRKLSTTLHSGKKSPNNSRPEGKGEGERRCLRHFALRAPIFYVFAHTPCAFLLPGWCLVLSCLVLNPGLTCRSSPKYCVINSAGAWLDIRHARKSHGRKTTQELAGFCQHATRHLVFPFTSTIDFGTLHSSSAWRYGDDLIRFGNRLRARIELVSNSYSVDTFNLLHIKENLDWCLFLRCLFYFIARTQCNSKIKNQFVFNQS